MVAGKAIAAYDGAKLKLPKSATRCALSKKRRRNKGPVGPAKEAHVPLTETRGVDGLTVAWMMSVVTTVLCGVVGGSVVLATRGQVGAESARAFGALLHFGAFVAAVVSLVLLACVLKFRKQPPPASITWFAVIAAFLAIATTFLY
jgi:hypothetical protein